MKNDIEYEKMMLSDMRKVIKKGNLKELKKYLFDSPITQNEIYANLKHNTNEALTAACYYGKLPLVEYLLNSSELKINADLHYKEDCAILSAIEGYQKHIIDYLLHSPELKEHINLSKNIDDIFNVLMENIYIEDAHYTSGDANGIRINEETVDIIDYLIYEKNISPTENIISLLKDNTKMSYYEPAIKRLNSNLLYNNLIESTKINNKETKKTKL